MTVYIFILLMAFFCFTDYIYYTIPNWAVLPAIVLGGVLTGNWMAAGIMFLLGVLLYNKEKLCGGDVKLMAMCGAFLGIWALPAFIISRYFVWLYRIVKKEKGILPYAPFISVSCIPFLWIK